MIQKRKYCKYCGQPLGPGRKGDYCGQKCKEQSPEGRVQATLTFLALMAVAAFVLYLVFVVQIFE